MATFKVSDVELSSKPLPATNAYNTIASRSTSFFPEAWSKPVYQTFGYGYDSTHGFISAVHTAYASHYPLVLTPDAVWMCIAQGLAYHVNENAEVLRKSFVEHKGKKELVVRRDDFVKGSPDNPWPEVFEAFSDQIRQYVGEKTHDLLTPDYSTTGPVERAAAQVVLMDTFKSYFGYRFHTMCGIPEITLKGTVEDWKRLRERATGLAQYDLQWWVDALKPILDQFVAAASGEVDRAFWSKMYKHDDMSGGPYISGWIVTLFPYLGSDSKRPHKSMGNWNSDEEYMGGRYGRIRILQGITTESFPSGVTSTPFTWEYLGEELRMQFRAGFLVVTQDPSTLAIHPEIGWAVSPKDGKKYNGDIF